ncbi:hypothetical protein HK105_200748 [Polyrhizophydium stewartii]|uniref:Phosducin domain-containing protein n=1 Tax=Polyrhizophydium stewartii TaxID=2732419 RepID=A0ABR4NK54_9FUNG|nr:hypothetical protein HK105_006177 [Polyrhizophydium stewartii]
MDADERIIQAILGGAGRDPDAEPVRGGSDIDSDVDSEAEAAAAAAAAQSADVDPDMARLLEDSAIRQQLGIGGSFTGPKGVANDYKFHKRQEAARAAARREADARRWSDRALSTGWMQRQLAAERKASASAATAPATSLEELEDEFEELENDDDYIAEYRARRILELQALSMRPRFGTVVDLDATSYVPAIDDEDPAVTVVVHLYQRTHEACRTVNAYLDRLATAYPTTKFARIISTVADAAFDDVALPALLVYEAGSLTHTLLRLTDEIDGWARTGRVAFEDFESYLWDMGVLRESDMALARSLGKMALEGDSGTTQAGKLRSGGKGGGDDDDDDDDD